MVISNIIGGLGNQMFQYAAGRALSLEFNTPLKLDISSFTNYGLHQGFELQRVFDCHAGIAIESETRSILGWQFSSAIRRIVAQPALAVIRREGFIVEPHYHYWPGIKNSPSDSYLVGYWLSEKYFQDTASVIRTDFTFKTPLVGQNAELAAQIDQVSAVSLHVRRGDYAKDPKTTATHGLCSLDYYRAAIQYVAARVDQPYFYIFSDDIDWVKAHLQVAYPCRYIGHNQGIESYNDMRLMSLCKHNIIANSTFSWWGSWLNVNANKIVVAPQTWLANTNAVSDYKQFMDDLIPSNWVAL